MPDPSVYGPGSRELQDCFDSRRIADRLADVSYRAEFSDADRQMIASAPMFFLATADALRRPDCSYKGGLPGFVRVTGPSELAWPDYDGNGQFRSLGNARSNPYVGLLFVDWAAPRRLRVNGEATVSDSDPLLAECQGAQLIVRVRVRHIFPNCPRYIHRMQLAETSPYAPRPAYEPPRPAWKDDPQIPRCTAEEGPETMRPEPFLAAAVQAAPVFLDREATVDKACALIADAARAGARLIVLPEAFVPGYPAWVWYLPLTRRADIAMLYRALVENAVDVPGPDVERLGRAARDAHAWVAIGVNERNALASGTTLYNTLLLFDDTGRLVERRRKLMPTGGERMIWAAGEPVVPRVHDTPLGRMSGLICWENYMPLARQAVYQGGTQVYLAPTWDKSDMWIASMRHIAREGRVFVIGCCQAIHRDQIPDRWPFKDALPPNLDWVNVGNSLIVDPEGAVIAGPLAEREGLVTAEIDPGRATGSRWIFDAAGHYNRPDLFELRIVTDSDRAALQDADARAVSKARATSKPRAAQVRTAGAKRARGASPKRGVSASSVRKPRTGKASGRSRRRKRA